MKLYTHFNVHYFYKELDNKIKEVQLEKIRQKTDNIMK